MSDEQRFDWPLFVLRNGKIVEDNVEEFLEWRKRTDPEAYRAVMHKLAEVIAEAAVRQLLAENAQQKHGHSRSRSRSPVKARSTELARSGTLQSSR